MDGFLKINIIIANSEQRVINNNNKNNNNNKSSLYNKINLLKITVYHY